MSGPDRPHEEATLPAGAFSTWLSDTRLAVRGERDAEVPCDGCTACCTASQFIHVGPDEADALEHIPRALLFPAPGRPPGHLVLGYDEHGRCPMLIDDRCSIYAHRPRTCRTYDCRVFPAAGFEPTEGTKVAIAARARRWRFDHPRPADRVRHDAVRAATAFLGEHAGELPAGSVPASPTQLAVLAVALHDLFLVADPVTGEPAAHEPTVRQVRDALRQRAT